ncbi:zinc ribbon domain-containing protein [Luteolibacter sp. Populi]|uniref:zinc ribbon domain-containing protein n=1 Tax=Luteolibacter sp. Populi TaxID=3230487 RepID=UPI00346547CE
MSPAIQALLLLQDRDKRLRGMIEDLERIPKDETRAKERLAGDQAAVKNARDTLMANEVDIKKVELDAATRRTTILRLKTQQFETRKNDEYQALGHEIVRYDKDVDLLETKELELMEKADALRTALAAAEQALAKTKQRVDEELAMLAERRKRVEGEAADLRLERERLAAAVPEEQLPLYERLLKNKNGIAVVPAIGGKCSGCHIKLVTSTMVRVNSGLDGVQCESCGRLLYGED